MYIDINEAINTHAGNIYNFRDLGANIWRISGIRKTKWLNLAPVLKTSPCTPIAMGKYIHRCVWKPLEEILDTYFQENVRLWELCEWKKKREDREET